MDYPIVLQAPHDTDAPVPTFPLERVSDKVWEAADVVSDFCTRKQRADTAGEYLALEGLVCAFENLFRALDHLDPRFDPDVSCPIALREVGREPGRRDLPGEITHGWLLSGRAAGRSWRPGRRCRRCRSAR